MKKKKNYLIIMKKSLYFRAASRIIINKNILKYVRFRLEDQVNAIQNLLNDVKINSHVGKRNAEALNHMNKRSVVDSNEEVSLIINRIICFLLLKVKLMQ